MDKFITDEEQQHADKVAERITQPGPRYSSFSRGSSAGTQIEYEYRST